MADYSEPIHLEPLFPAVALSTRSRCPHNRRIARGSRLCCMICHHSGQDHLQLEGKPVGSQLNEDYVPDPVVTVYAPPARPTRETRKQRRARQRAEKLAAESKPRRAGDYPIEPSVN